MEAIVLAGGFGTRLRAVLPNLPKPMAPVAGRPFLEILLEKFARQGFCRVVLSLGYMAEAISSHFGPRFNGLEIVYEVETSPLGTGGALRRALTHCATDHAFVFNGDTYLDLEVGEVESLWQTLKAPIIVGREVEDTARYGRLEVHDGRVVGFAEKGMVGPGVINAGCYVLPMGLLGEYPLDVPFSFESDFLLNAVKKQFIGLYLTHGHFIDIGVPEDYARAQVELAGSAR